LPNLDLSSDFCGFAGRLGADVEYQINTRHVIDDYDDSDSGPAEGDGASGPSRGYRSRDSVLVVGGRVAGEADRFGEAADLIYALARRQAQDELGVSDWKGGVDSLKGRSWLFGDPDWVFVFATAEAGPCVALGFADQTPGLAVDLAGRVLSPGSVERFAAAERAWIMEAQEVRETPAEKTETGGCPWASLRPEANRRAVEVWAKKRAYLTWRGEWLDGGWASFSVLDSEALGVTFWPVGFAQAPDVVGWVCTADERVKGVETVWADEPAVTG
jgi:hypothetical protein